MSNFDWLVKKNLRSVDQLRLWPENPRLNPEETHLTIANFAEELTTEQSERKEFQDLIKSIAEKGFIPADPVVVWQNEDNHKFYVAEGNRRVIALKLLRDPQKSPKSIRSFVRKCAEKIDLTSIEKIHVNIAPSFEDAEWYINQRNSTSSLQRPWSRIQQQRWIATLYNKYNGDIDKIMSIAELEQSELEAIIRILKIRDFIKEDIVRGQFSEEEYEKANSFRFPITILERFFGSKEVRERWGLEFDGMEVRIISNKASFLIAYANLIKRIINNSKNNEEDINIDTRTITSNLEDILNSLPIVDLTPSEQDNNQEEPALDIDNDATEDESTNGDNETPNQYIHLKNNVNRGNILLPIYHVQTDSARILGLFEELKKIPFRYPNHIASSIRVFLDLSVLKYIETEGLDTALQTAYNAHIRDIPLKKKIEYLKANKFNGNIKKIATRLVDESQQYSLDVLNGYIHGQDTHYHGKTFLNGFWDFLFPLFQTLLDIREENV